MYTDLVVLCQMIYIAFNWEWTRDNEASAHSDYFFAFRHLPVLTASAAAAAFRYIFPAINSTEEREIIEQLFIEEEHDVY